MSQGLVTDALKHHILNAKNHGVTKEEMAAIITHTAFYSGWPKGWAVFNMAKEIYGDIIVPG
ncbi:MAG: carboxymuconolactone decarboxylase family protein [Lachnospiraceae bacterium]|nr:carboxymuconolactone decarboxylase family protein [Lachnospiraceae bacterium]